MLREKLLITPVDICIYIYIYYIIIYNNLIHYVLLVKSNVYAVNGPIFFNLIESKEKVQFRNCSKEKIRTCNPFQ